MITFFYCCICLLIVCSCYQTAKFDSQENDCNNDAPDILPKTTYIKFKIGADFMLKCNSCNNHKDNITWEFKPCETSNRACILDQSVYKLDYTEGQWKKLDFKLKRKKLQIKNATEKDNGLYRCLYNDSIIKIYRVDIYVPAFRRHSPPPKILSLRVSSNQTIILNMPVVIQCKINSVIEPVIHWLKECNSMRTKCDMNSRIAYDGQCYCTLPNSTYASLNIGENSNSTGNSYLSKLSISAARLVESGTYVCLAMSEYGEDHKNVTVVVEDLNSVEVKAPSNSFSLLFLIPLFFVLVPIILWFGCYRGKAKSRQHRASEHQKQLIQPVVEV